MPKLQGTQLHNLVSSSHEAMHLSGRQQLLQLGTEKHLSQHLKVTQGQIKGHMTKQLLCFGGIVF